MFYKKISLEMPVKTVERLEKLAIEYGFSRANMALQLIQEGLMAHGEPIEVSRINPNGEVNKHGIAVRISNGARRLL